MKILILLFLISQTTLAGDQKRGAEIDFKENPHDHELCARYLSLVGRDGELVFNKAFDLIDFDPENIQEGIYQVTFSTVGRELKVHTTDYVEEGQEVGLTFEVEDIHVMEKMGF